MIWRGVRAGIARIRAPPNSLQAEPATGITEEKKYEKYM